jgi:hypothetical protein
MPPATPAVNCAHPVADKAGAICVNLVFACNRLRSSRSNWFFLGVALPEVSNTFTQVHRDGN